MHEAEGILTMHQDREDEQFREAFACRMKSLELLIRLNDYCDSRQSTMTVDQMGRLLEWTSSVALRNRMKIEIGVMLHTLDNVDLGSDWSLKGPMKNRLIGLLSVTGVSRPKLAGRAVTMTNEREE